MASEQALDVALRRHISHTERPFQVVLDRILGGISQPDIGELFGSRTQVVYDTLASVIARYRDAAASEVAERLDVEVLNLLCQATKQSDPNSR